MRDINVKRAFHLKTFVYGVVKMHFLWKQQRLRSAFFLNTVQIIMLTMKGGKWAARWLMALLKNSLLCCFLEVTCHGTIII